MAKPSTGGVGDLFFQVVGLPSIATTAARIEEGPLVGEDQNRAGRPEGNRFRPQHLEERNERR